MKRILALDYGRRRVGVAISDPLGVTAQPAGVMDGRDMEKLIHQISKLIKQKHIEKILLGYPLHMSGETGRGTQRVSQFADRLFKETKIPVKLWDERLTSVQAQNLLHQMGRKPSRNKDKIDTISAVLILQNYLEHQQFRQQQDKKETD